MPTVAAAASGPAPTTLDGTWLVWEGNVAESSGVGAVIAGGREDTASGRTQSSMAAKESAPVLTVAVGDGSNNVSSGSNASAVFGGSQTRRQ
jgi:hypothetical protein